MSKRIIIAKLYVANIAEDLSASAELAAATAAATPANLKATVYSDRKEEVATQIMHSGKVDLSPEKDSQGHRI